jgi:uncharacterized protein YqjF (DUF2071 family)
MNLERPVPTGTPAGVLPRAYLRAGWYHLAMLNYPADAAMLQRYVPAGTELDVWKGKPYLSMVGFMMLNTRVHGIPIPCHRNFEEVNLRTYVRRKTAGGWRRGVVFIKEIVPRRMIAFVARRVYNENYVADAPSSRAAKRRAAGRQRALRMVPR